MLLATAVYWPGLSGGFLFDDYPNIVDNPGVHPQHADIASILNAALSSPSSEFKRPLASLSFALNYLADGLDPFGMKLTNLVIHLLNGLLIFILAKQLLTIDARTRQVEQWYVGVVAVLVSASWMLLPINLTGVLYVVQRMESLANLFVLMGLIGYVKGRNRMLAVDEEGLSKRGIPPFALCVLSIIIPTAIGILAKETAVMLPLYAWLIEWALFSFRDTWRESNHRRDRRVIALFVLVLAVPMVAGLAWLAPSILSSQTWASRDFSLRTRLLSEARIVADYIRWTLLPTPDALSFYHDNFRISSGFFKPWTTAASIALLAAFCFFTIWIKRRRPLVALGLALFFGCQLLTGTILPLELIYEHRNYFASFGLLLALVPLLAARATDGSRASAAMAASRPNHHERAGTGHRPVIDGLPLAAPRHLLLGGLMVCWTALTAMTAYAWGSPLRLAEDLASRAPDSPRAEYELGRTYIIYSHYDPSSPFTKMAYVPLEKSAALPDSSILPEQALIFMNSRMHLPLKDAWWDSMIAKLQRRKPGVQDGSSLDALTKCMRSGNCDLPKDRMTEAYLAALSHPNPEPRLLAMYGDYAWNELGEHDLGQRMLEEAVQKNPSEPAYQITLIRMLVAQGEHAKAREAFARLKQLNIGGRLDGSLDELRKLSAPQ